MPQFLSPLCEWVITLVVKIAEFLNKIGLVKRKP
jgi:hypothetical protein